MVVHLIRTDDCSEELYKDVLALLQTSRGAFIFVEGDVVSFDGKPIRRIFVDEEEFTKKNELPMQEARPMESRNYRFPRETLSVTWKKIFSTCNKYRIEKSIPEADHVVLLTGHSNEHNWFGAIEPDRLNGFVQTSDWGFYFSNEVDRRLPVAYEIMSWLFRRYVFSDIEEMKEHVHFQPKGCYMDFCSDKKEVILKMRTGDLCQECMKHLSKCDINPSLSYQVFQLFDKISSALKFKERFAVRRQYSRMELRGPLKKIHLSDIGELEISLNPLQRSLYLLFLEHPSGIALPTLYDHKSRLLQFYEQFSNKGSREEMSKAIDRLVDTTENSINENLARIKRAFTSKLGEEMAKQYFIQGERNSQYRILLDRTLVSHVQ